MAKISATVPVAGTWAADDRVQLRVGSEEAASLAASTPSGGVLQRERTVGDLAGEDADLVLQAELIPNDPSATVPIGVQVLDVEGNASTVLERFALLADPPDGPRDLAVAATATAGEAALSWTASDHVPGDGVNFRGFDFLGGLAPLRPFAFGVAGPRYAVYQRSTRTGADTFVAAVAPGATSYLYQVAMPGAADTERFLFVRAISRREVADVEAIGPRLVRVAFDAAGALIAAAPNVPTGVTLTPTSGGGVLLEFRYSPYLAEAEVAMFDVYVATGVSAMPSTPTETVPATGARRYQVELGPYAHGTTVRVQLSSETAGGVASSATAEISTTADVNAPAAPASLTVEVK